MDNMHAPTIPSGPTSNGYGINGTRTAGHTLPELQTKKDNIEAELKALSRVLDSHGVNMNTPLTTPDGFPRADLDVAQIRTTRTRIIYLKNDYKSLMAVIEKAIHEHFANQTVLPSPNATTSTTPSTSTDRGLTSRPSQTLEPPFAKVNSVVEGSPAEEATLKAGDEIRMFGYVNAGNHEGLRRVAECVQGNEGHNVLVKVSRRSGLGGSRQELTLTLTPRRDWGGRGMLGCHILPL